MLVDSKPNMNARIKAVIFDFDGIIISSKVAEYISWRRVFGAYNCRLDIRKWIRIIDNPMGEFDPAKVLFDKCKYKDKIKMALRPRLYRYFSPPATASGRNCGISLRYNDHHFGSHSCDGLPI